jgi:hypothetical protein
MTKYKFVALVFLTDEGLPALNQGAALRVSAWVSLGANKNPFVSRNVQITDCP